MKATLVFLADDNTENMLCKMMLDAELAGNVGFEAARLPRHISLRQPIEVDDLSKIEELAKTIAHKTPPFTVDLQPLDCHPLNIHGKESGWYGFQFAKDARIDAWRKQAKEELSRLYPGSENEPDMVDQTYHVTLAGGGGLWDAYEKAYEAVKDKNLSVPQARFDHVALFFYTVGGMMPGTYFCYQRYPLTGKA